MDRLKILKDRAELLSRAREFFHNRGVLEVDCPLLSQRASVDAHIDLISALFEGKQPCTLHSSPEYGMKRLLVEGIGDIFQLSHVFRDGEYGIKHNPEFMMAEWYRLGFSLEQMAEETCDFIRLFLGDLPSRTLSYRKVFQHYAGIDYLNLSSSDLLKFLDEHKIDYYPGIEKEGKDAILNIILGTLIEPRLGQDELFVLSYYPATQAALAKTKEIEGEKVASRFEVYYRGVELANGYHELADASEQRMRLNEANETRISLGKKPLPIDELFLKALERGLPDCSGVAVGFDRLMMLRHQCARLSEVIPFDWPNA